MIYLQILIAIILGCIAGTFTGLFPGVHINLVATILLSLSPLLIPYSNILAIAAFIIAMSITHTFTDFISSTYLGVPSDDTALALLPAHKMLMEGMGHEAIRLSVIGSLLCLIAVIIFSPLLIIAVPFIFSALKNYIAWILLAVILLMIVREEDNNKRFWTFVVTMLSGILGIIVLNMPNLKDPLLPMLSGLFGVCVLSLSISQKSALPLQRTTEMIKVKFQSIIKAIFNGMFSGSLVSIFPGLGPAQAAVISSQMSKKTDSIFYIIVVSGINTVSMILSLITLYTINKARNGSIIVVQELMPDVSLKTLIFFLAVALVSGGIASFITIFCSKIFSSIMNKVNYSMLSIGIITIVFVMVTYFSGIVGILILITATAIGLIPNLMETSRSASMSCLILPIVIASLI
ncbi:MAG TPA: tripartite tricarboxylate transporter permease [Candidatus Nanoarchaeia archaeon]|nr:tripartite tricarboxylate transporter permease [Candidatus Nanoarchaeia archaeon]